MTTDRVHLHQDDYPVTLDLLTELLSRRAHDPVGLAEIGWEPTEVGVWVEWDRLTSSWLSSTEIGIVQIARGLATIEVGGGVPPRMAGVLCGAVALVAAGGSAR